MSNDNYNSVCEYHIKDTVIVVRRFFQGKKSIQDLILETISTKKSCAN